MICIFGAAGGVGRAVAGHLIDHYGGPVVSINRKECDVTSPDSVEECFARLNDRYPVSDPWHVVNCAGACFSGTIADGRVNAFDAELAVNTRAPYLLFKYMHPYLVGRPNSSVTLLSSVVAPLGVAGAAGYGKSKAALSGLVRAAAKEFARYRCRVNALEMGYFDIGMIDKVPAAAQVKLIDEIPLHRFGNAYDIGVAAKFAIECHYLTGAVVPVNGGLL